MANPYPQPGQPGQQYPAGYPQQGYPQQQQGYQQGYAQPGARPIPVQKGQAGQNNNQKKQREEEEEPEKPMIQGLDNAPPWLVSAVVHVVLVIVLALIYSVQYIPNEVVNLDVNWNEKEGEQLEDDKFEMKVEDPAEVTEQVLNDKPIVDDPFAAPPEMEVVDVTGHTAVSNIKAPSIGMALNGREDGATKEALLSRYGGNPQGEKAVMNALEWLARVQNPHTGGWSLKGVEGSRYSDGATHENTSAATAMALLAFQGAGNTHLKGKFKKNVAKGWEFLIKAQQADGSMFAEGIHNSDFYTHGQCTIAICELYGMSKDPKFEEPARKAVDFCIKTQNRLGGWRYTRGSDGTCTESDLSVTGWIVMGLQSARMAKMKVPQETLDKISSYLDKNQTNGGSHYGYTGPGDSEVMTAEGLLCRQYLGWKQDNRSMTSGADFLLTKLPTWNDRNVYYWYYATQVMHHLEGKRWTTWNGVMRDLLINHQQQNGGDKGSWDPKGDRWAGDGGRLYTTCLSVYILEVYYRHLPIYAKIAL